MALKEVKYEVALWEHERGWGVRLDDVIQFDSENEARSYVSKFNSKNKELTGPDWYMTAEYVGVKVID